MIIIFAFAINIILRISIKYYQYTNLQFSNDINFITIQIVLIY